MPDYSLGKVYKITSANTTDIYIGSTCKRLAARFSHHKSGYKASLTRPQSTKTTAHSILQYYDCKIELLEDVSCSCLEELLARECWHIKNEPTCVNKVIPTRTKKQYYEDNIESILAKNAQYNAANREAILAQKAQYYAANREAINAQRRSYRASKSNKVDCPCGGSYVSYNASKHIVTKKHQQYITQ